MRAVFSGLCLLLVLAMVGLAAVRQLKAQAPAAAPPVAGASTLPASPVVTPAQGRQVQEKVRIDLDKAVQQNAARLEEADK